MKCSGQDRLAKAPEAGKALGWPNITIGGRAVARTLIVFLRYPEPGRVKTRLAAGMGAAPAAAFYERLLRRTLGIVADFWENHRDVEIVLFFDPMEREAEVRWAFPGPWRFVAQPSGHLGERMRAACDLGSGQAERHSVVIGCDIGDLQSADLDDAFRALNHCDAVLGPARDGGFYLIGLARRCDAVFLPASWGGSEVCGRALATLQREGLTVALGKERNDIDRVEDLMRLPGRDYFDRRVAIIIPFLGSPSRLEKLLEFLEPQLWPADEIILVSGEGLPGTATCRISARTRMVRARRGRGLQLNCGVRESRSDLLWFLHEDSTPPPNFAYHVRKLVLSQHHSLGCFRLAFDGHSRALALIARWANIRTSILQLPYGDQGIFCERATYDQLNGFRRAYIMEDVDFVRSARRLGKLLIIPQPLRTSPARYVKCGILRASLVNHLLFGLYLAGIDDRKLYSWYYRC
ncbi:MAG TPA: hypothetical protein DEO88_01415 [Syntrophobacteraceae bacterium]|nr:hypothetical protein [Syntrophobacteraceae bacterium]